MPSSQPFIVHNEIGNAQAAAFADSWMPAAQRAMAKHLGTLWVKPVHVILSDAATHVTRFPPEADELIRVLDPGQADEARQDPTAVAAEYPRSIYAFGVATRISPVHRPPIAAVDGQVGIYLDLETPTKLARELTVDPQALTAAVLVHELELRAEGLAEYGEAAERNPQLRVVIDSVNGWDD